jgi:hypothetical protein
MGDGPETTELRASGASEEAPYEQTLPPERYGCWADRGASALLLRGRNRRNYVSIYMRGRTRRRTGTASEHMPRARHPGARFAILILITKYRVSSLSSTISSISSRVRLRDQCPRF